MARRARLEIESLLAEIAAHFARIERPLGAVKEVLALGHQSLRDSALSRSLCATNLASSSATNSW